MTNTKQGATKRRNGVSYCRFSNLKQGKGDSEDRQEQDFANFCTRHHLTPQREVYTDRGRSGYHDAHRKKGRLGDLIAAAKDNCFEPGTVIVCESWDRLGRLRPDLQTALITELLQTGVSIGICKLDDIFSLEDFGSFKWAGLATFVMLAYQESKQKSQRITSAWVKRHKQAREKGTVFSARLPGWLRLVDGVMVPVPERIAAVQRIFELSADGNGKTRIIKTLVKEKVPNFGTSAGWSVPYIGKILNDRRVLGEHQPRKGDGTPSGPVMPTYFVRIVSDETFALARAAQDDRRRLGGPGRGKGTRDRNYTNTFQSILKSAPDGGAFFLANRGTAAAPILVLVSQTRDKTFPFIALETEILQQLVEIDPRDVLPRHREPADTTETLGDKLAIIRADIANYKADLKRDGYSRGLAQVLREREAEEEIIVGQVQDELARTARPAERLWQKLPGLVDMIKEHGDVARLKIRTVLRSLVADMRLLQVRRGRRLVAAVQVVFTSGASRMWLVIHLCGHKNRDPITYCPPSLRVEALCGGDIDLRRKKDTLRLQKALLECLDAGTMPFAQEWPITTVSSPSK